MCVGGEKQERCTWSTEKEKKGGVAEKKFQSRTLTKKTIPLQSVHIYIFLKHISLWSLKQNKQTGEIKTNQEEGYHILLTDE